MEKMPTSFPQRRESTVRKQKNTKFTMDSRLRGNDIADNVMTLGHSRWRGFVIRATIKNQAV